MNKLILFSFAVIIFGLMFETLRLAVKYDRKEYYRLSVFITITGLYFLHHLAKAII